eukprot:CAMPEP_0197656992 /NCGR_PEP_ID=MMETSP1338-20131121/44303_1 /TAXON_ID=43686 ORGANISM="Pelagodinium beii, Strain RCC1491" /NCGR_SAMPLE_ID=MMETSP1338 /ASSEMBLY_ACC=CAM_ASM_000754 /LENGTH=233 /DNA_ID=CAMNT_0043233265 /DNA_START=83 /DNA_END=784 /DNA_ORIENTATION=+
MPTTDKYAIFGDNTMKDRVAFAHAHEIQHTEAPAEEDPSQQKSGFTSEGWDKYYFFSNPAKCAGPGQGNLHPTARQGRNRPAMIGPQTFTIEAFTPEELRKARIKIEAKGARTTYTESYTQIPRSSTAMLGPVEQPTGPHILAMAKASGQSVSDTLTSAGFESLGRSLSATEILAGPKTAKRMGPHWPPPGPERPDPIKTRAQLMGGAHRSIDDLHAKDRKAPDAYHYTLTRY